MTSLMIAMAAFTMPGNMPAVGTCSEIREPYNLAKLSPEEEASLQGRRALFRLQVRPDDAEIVIDGEQWLLFAVASSHRGIVVPVPNDSKVPKVVNVEATLQIEWSERYATYRLRNPVWHGK